MCNQEAEYYGSGPQNNIHLINISGLYKQEPVHTIHLTRNNRIKDGQCKAIGNSFTKLPSCEICYCLLCLKVSVEDGNMFP